jgi:hypothetical protein
MCMRPKPLETGYLGPTRRFYWESVTSLGLTTDTVLPKTPR